MGRDTLTRPGCSQPCPTLAVGSRRRHLAGAQDAQGRSCGRCPGSFHMNHTLFASEPSPRPGQPLPGVISCPPRSPPSAPACPSPAASSRPPRGLSMLPENKSQAIFNRGENAKVSTSLGSAEPSADGHPRRDEGGRGMCGKDVGRQGSVIPLSSPCLRAAFWGRQGEGRRERGTSWVLWHPLAPPCSKQPQPQRPSTH